jgi:hypothetical protein
MMTRIRDDGTMGAKVAELFFVQIGLADSRERGRLLMLGKDNPLTPCEIAASTAVVDVRTTDSSTRR